MGVTELKGGNKVKTLFALLLFCVMAIPAAGQDYNARLVKQRTADMVIQVFDPEALEGVGEFRTIRFSDLLAGAVRFPDSYVRYVFTLEWTGSTPTVGATEIQGGTVGDEGSIKIQFPNPPAGAMLVAVGFAIPVAAGLPTYSAIGVVNSGLNGIFNFAQQTGAVDLTIDGEIVAYNVWVTTSGFFPVPSNRFLFLISP